MSEIIQIPYVKFSDNPVKDFFKRFYLTDINPISLIIISPIIGDLSKTRYSLERLLSRIENEKMRKENRKLKGCLPYLGLADYCINS